MTTPTVVSVNVGLPRIWTWQGQSVLSAIDKRPVTGPVPLRGVNLAGDQQADLTVHGGPDKAVYVYPAAYYAPWQQELPGVDLLPGVFGENLTISELDDTSVHIGDHYRIGTATVLVTQPRLPCYKLGMKFGRASFLKQFLRSRRSGFYLAVLEEGEVATGDLVTLLHREDHGITVADVVRLYIFEREDVDGLRRAVTANALPEWLREEFQERLNRLT